MTDEKLFELLGNIDEKYIGEAKGIERDNVIIFERMGERTMRKNRTKKSFKRTTVAAATLAVCVCLTGVTALATTGKLNGFFKDIKSWTGAVIGTTYEQATDEIQLSVVEVSEDLTVEVSMVDPEKAPYSSFEMFGIENYKIVDTNGNTVVEGETSEMKEVIDGKVSINIALDTLAEGNYELIVSEMVGSSKADQPLVISGTWEAEFETE